MLPLIPLTPLMHPRLRFELLKLAWVALIIISECQLDQVVVVLLEI